MGRAASLRKFRQIGLGGFRGSELLSLGGKLLEARRQAAGGARSGSERLAATPRSFFQQCRSSGHTDDLVRQCARRQAPQVAINLLVLSDAVLLVSDPRADESTFRGDSARTSDTSL